MYLTELSNKRGKINNDDKKKYTDFLSTYYDYITGNEKKTDIKKLIEEMEF